MPKSTDAISLGRFINEISRNMNYYISRSLSPYGLGKDDFDVLSILSKYGSIEQGRLIEILKSEKYTVTKIVGRLHKKDLIERWHDSRDRRRLHISLTAEGEKLLPALEELKKNITLILSKQVQFDQAATVLSQMAENMRTTVIKLKEEK